METCVHCGCSDERACPGGCYWIVPGLCSACAFDANGYALLVLAGYDAEEVLAHAA